MHISLSQAHLKQETMTLTAVSEPNNAITDFNCFINVTF